MKTVPVAQTKSRLSKSILLAAAVFAGLSQLKAMPIHDIVTYANRGFAAAKKNDNANALANFNQAIRLYPKNAATYYYRGLFYFQRKQYRLALHDFNTAVDLQPTLLIVATVRATTKKDMGFYSQAIAEYNRVLTLSPHADERALDLNNRAWVEASCPDARWRNGAQAVKDAREACSFARWKSPVYLDTLAAAYAEANDFVSAVKYEQQAIGRLKDKKDLADYQKRLALYQNHKPFRDEDNKPAAAIDSSVGR